MKLRSTLTLASTLPLSLVLNTSLQASDVVLEPQVVTGQIISGADRHPGTVDRVSAEEIARSGATSVQEVLQNLPGVYLQKAGNVAQDAPSIRGFSAEQTLVLVDGKRVPNTDRNLSFQPAYRYNWVPVSQIERVEVIRGPAATLYGADAMAGVINIVTKKAGKEWVASVDGELGYRDGDHQSDWVSAAVGGPLGSRGDFNLSVSERNEEPIVADDGTTRTSELNSRTLQTGVGIALSDTDRVEVDLLLGRDEAWEIGPAHGFGMRTTELEQDRRLLSTSYLTRLGGFDLQFSATQGRTDLLEGSSDWEVDEDNYEASLEGRLGERHRLSTGLLHRREDVARNDKDFDDSVNATTLTFQDRISLTSRQALTLGVAYDHHSRYDDEISPSIYWNWGGMTGLGLKAGYGESYMAPGLSKATSDYVIPAGPTRRYEGNDDLEPETNATFELGASYSQPEWETSITLFHNRIDDLITTGEYQDGRVTVAQYQNVDEAITQGVEAEFDLRAGEYSRLRASYTWLDSENRAERYRGNALADTPEHLFKVVAEHTLPNVGSTLYGAWRYTASQYADSANSDKIDAYHVVDLGVSQPVGQYANVRLGLDNVFDEVVESGGEFLEPGRELSLRVSADF
ncbi:TonB-dependent receptor plug domain-containing protein [Vreelandella massiliensis]|uniref:TonB-dependent receptor plug domain-containing protein n=1 Tax=Vreelandella massiliensis TaxID=1816686 RepID=UPI00096A2DDF|nr:TonB-dependent receptor [Halomonas massiliensis]